MAGSSELRGLISGDVRVIGAELVNAKLLASEARILARNRELVAVILETAKPTVIAGTPSGPAHFGYHGRDTVKIKVETKGPVTVGKLVAAIQIYWREYGTRGRFRGPRRGSRLRTEVGVMTGAIAAGGEPARMLAHKSVGSVRRFIAAYYGGMAAWWKS